MKIREIRLDDDGIPSEVTVTMTILEAWNIAHLFGSMNDQQFAEKGILHDSSIYDGLTGGLFNKFWDEGVDGARKDVR